MTKRVLALELGAPKTGRELAALSPYIIVWNEPDVAFEIDYAGEP